MRLTGRRRHPPLPSQGRGKVDREKVPRRKQACPANFSRIRSGRSNAAFFIHERSTFNPRLARIRSLSDHAHPRDCRVRRPVLGRAFLLTLFGRRPRCVQSGRETATAKGTARTMASTLCYEKHPWFIRPYEAHIESSSARHSSDNGRASRRSPRNLRCRLPG